MESIHHPPTTSSSSKGPTEKGPQNRAVATSLLKALDLLTVLARRKEGLPVSIIVRKLKSPRTSVLRMLTTLEQYGLTARKGHIWCATEQFYEWSSRATHDEIKHKYESVISAIALEVGELVVLSIGEAGGVRYIDWKQGPHQIAVDPLKSAIYPLHRTAAGKLLLSQQPDLWNRFDDPKLLAEIAEARATGVAINRRESDTNVLGVAIWAAGPSLTTPIICVKWPFFRFTEAKATRAIAVVRRELLKVDR